VGEVCSGIIWPLDLISKLGIALGEPRLYISYIDRSKALRVFNNLDRHDRYIIYSFLSFLLPVLLTDYN